MPGYLDRRLAREAWDGQIEPARGSQQRSDNLHAPVPRDAGAHGRFDAVAVDFSLQWWLNARREWLALGATGLLAFGALLRRTRSTPRRRATARTRTSARGA